MVEVRSSAKKIPMEADVKKRLGWHFISADRRLGYNDGRTVRVGVRLKYKPRKGIANGFLSKTWSQVGPKICRQGMHAAPTLVDAKVCWDQASGRYPRPTDWVCRVLVEGTGDGPKYSLHNEYHTPKFVGSYRTVLGMIRYGEAYGKTERQIIELMRKRNRRNGTKIEVK